MKLRATILLGLLCLSLPTACVARGGGGGAHGGGGGGHMGGGGGGGHIGGGGGYRGGGGVGLGYSGGGERSSGWGNGGGWGNNYHGADQYPNERYGGYGYGYGGYGVPNAYDSSYAGSAYAPQPNSDPLADYYRQQAIASQMAQAQTQTNVSAMPLQTYMQPSGSSSMNAAMQQASSLSNVDLGNEVRDNFHGSGVFAPTWWKSYKSAWCNPAWPASWVWSSVDWSTLARFWGISSAKPAGEYDFGENVKYENGIVYFGDQPTAKAAEFYLIAQSLAAKGAVKQVKGAKVVLPTTSDWQPFGVFSLVHSGQKFSTTLFQLAINKQGLVRGNCYNILTGQLDPVFGAGDKTNSRVAFTVGGNHNVVYDSGLGNLLSAQSSILVHMNKDDREQMTLVRLRQAKL